jgi:hypothetical protein
MVAETGRLTGFVGGPAGNRLVNRQTTPILREIRAIKQICEYHRESQENGQCERPLELMTHYLQVLGRGHRIPMDPPYTYSDVNGWIRDHAGSLLKALRLKVSHIEGSILRHYHQTEDRLFQDQSSRSQWLDTVGLGKQVKPPPRTIIDSKSNRIIRDPAEIKKVYIQEGAPLLQNEKEAPSQSDPSPDHPGLDAPDLETRDPFKEEDRKQHIGAKPAWWDKMYCRQAKGIASEIWLGLMENVTKKELLQTIQDMDKHKRQDMMTSKAI